MTKKMAQNREKRLAKLNVLKFILVLYSRPLFLLWREIFITTGKTKVPVLYWKKKDTVVCLAGARSITTGKNKDTVVCLMGARFWQLRPENYKDTVVFLAGYAVWSFFVVVAGKFYYYWKKKDTVVCLAGARSL